MSLDCTSQKENKARNKTSKCDQEYATVVFHGQANYTARKIHITLTATGQQEHNEVKQTVPLSSLRPNSHAHI